MIGETAQLPDSGLPPPMPSDSAKPRCGEAPEVQTAKEIGGREGPDPTRYGDWEKNGRCIDF
ncbi:MAG: DUF1674 domain-containing protein [Luteimonas sp.]